MSATSARSSRPPRSVRSSRLLPGKDGLLHISEIKKMAGKPRIDSVDDVLSIGQKIRVAIKEIDDRGKLSLVRRPMRRRRRPADRGADTGRRGTVDA